MRSEHKFKIRAARKLRVRFCTVKNGLVPSRLPTDRSKAVPLLLSFFVCVSVPYVFRY